MSKDSSDKYYKNKQRKPWRTLDTLSEEEENKNWEYGCKQYKNLPEHVN